MRVVDILKSPLNSLIYRPDILQPNEKPTIQDSKSHPEKYHVPDMGHNLTYTVCVSVLTKKMNLPCICFKILNFLFFPLFLAIFL